MNPRVLSSRRRRPPAVVILSAMTLLQLPCGADQLLPTLPINNGAEMRLPPEATGGSDTRNGGNAACEPAGLVSVLATQSGYPRSPVLCESCSHAVTSAGKPGANLRIRVLPQILVRGDSWPISLLAVHEASSLSPRTQLEIGPLRSWRTRKARPAGRRLPKKAASWRGIPYDGNLLI
jgi:hypothetical protein